MANSVDMLIRVLADTGQAQTSINSLVGTLGKVAGVGAVGAGAAAVTQAAIDYQSSFARMQSAVNSVDFAPGTKSFEDAKNQIILDSVTLATSVDDTSKVYAQALKFMDDSGQRLSTDKINEYTDTMIRLSKVSTDQMSAMDIGQQMDVFEKLYGQTNFAQHGSELSALSGVHNQGEGVTLAAAVPIAQYGAEMGVTPEQALAVATYLADRGAGGGMSGASIGRMFQRMDASADTVLDPEVAAGDAKKARTAREHLDDLQTSLKEADARQAQMYGQHGLKTQYKRDPAAVMAEQDRIAKLQRDIADSEADMAATGGSGKAPPRGQLNVPEMAKTAGMDATDFADLVKSDPMDALLAYTRGLSQIPESERQAAERKAGLTNVRDIKTANVLAAEPDVLSSYLDIANQQKANPTDLGSRSQTILDTTAAKEQDAKNALTTSAAIIGEPARQLLDEGLTAVLNNVQTNGFGPLEEKMRTVDTAIDATNSALGTFVQQLGVAGTLQVALAGAGLLKAVASGMGTGGAAAGAAGAAGGLAPGQGNFTASGAPTPLPGGTIANQYSRIAAANFVGAGTMAGLSLMATDLGSEAEKAVEDLLHNKFGLTGLSLPKPEDAGPAKGGDFRPSQVVLNIDAVHTGGQTAEAAFDAIKQQFIAAWTAAMSHLPVTGQQGGLWTSGQNPR